MDKKDDVITGFALIISFLSTMASFYRFSRAFFCCLLLTIHSSCLAFCPARVKSRKRSFSLSAFSNDDLQQRVDAMQEESTREALVKALVAPEDDSLVKINFLGRTELPTSRNNSTIPCLVLSPNDDSTNSATALCMPITSPQLKLLSFAYQAKPISKSLCLQLNPLLVNRDGGLFENLPWSTWTIDPQQRNRDAANNNIDPRFHLGKRDAYNRFMGKDWKGRSVSLGNMALRLKYMLEEENDENDSRGTDASDSSQVLARRILEMQIRELEMECAEWDYQMAIARRNAPEQLAKLEEARRECQDRIRRARNALSDLLNESTDSTVSDRNTPLLSSLLEKVVNMTTDDGRNAAPYRGAMGYAPLLDTQEDLESSILPFTSPFDLLRDIIDDQLNAQVIGCLIENTSLLQGTAVLGGAVILRRKTPKITMTIAGEELSINDDDEDYGNRGIKGGETFLVECDGDEAVGMSLACDVPIRIEQSILQRTSMATVRVQAPTETNNVYDSVPLWEPIDKEMSLLVEGQARNQTNREQTSPLFVPKTTTSLFDSMFDGSSPSDSSSSSSSMFPNDNPIQSLEEYDALSNGEKARTLTMLSNFQGKLPRPRVLRQQKEESENALDKLLLPLIDESVRRQYLIRDAERRGDKETLQRLKSEKSRRQMAREKAEQARQTGSDDVAEWWENEADFYEGLRADVTQDEGSYSRFLDKDEWYERDRLARAKRTKKSSFGTLLDGIE